MFDHNAEIASKSGHILSAPVRSRTVHVIVIAAVVVLALLAGLAAAGQAAVGAATTAAQLTIPGASNNASCAVQSSSGGTEVTAGGLSAEQVQLAHTIWQAAHETGFGDRGAIIAIATAAQESTLGANRATRAPNGDVDVASFQQRALPGWYAPGKTVAENVEILNDPAYAARTFFQGYTVTAADVAAARANGTAPAGPVGYTTPGLASVDGWESMPVTVAAQKVQRSAFPDAYAKHEGMARELVAKFGAEETPPVSTAAIGDVGPPPTSTGPLCDPPGAVDPSQCPESGLPAEEGLTPDGLRVLRCAFQQWPDLEYGGVRQDALPDYPSGRAVDIMVPGSCDPLGQTIADWAKENAEPLGVDYVIWCQKIWSAARDSEGWRPMGDRGSNTQDHGDHVHVTVKGNSAGVAETVPASAENGATTAVAPLEGYTASAWFGKPGKAWSSGYHTGTDFAAPVGTPIRAVKAGVCSGPVSHGAYGNLVKIDHGGGVESWYAHLNAPSSCTGPVQAGQVIGDVGCTGNCYGPHLHLEYRVGERTQDPVAWLAGQGVVLHGFPG